VFINNDQDGTAVLLALDAATGKTVWESPRKAFRACYSTPLVLENPGQPPELIVASTAGVTSYDPQTGSEKWSYTWTFDRETLRTVGSPVFAQGLIFVSSGNGGGDRHAIAVKAGGKGDVTSSALAWESKRIFPYVPTMLTRGEHLYYVNDLGIAGCHVARTGATVWNERLGGNISASPIMVDGKIYVCSEEGEVNVFAAEPSFKLLAKNKMGEGIMATPAVADGRLYIRGKSHLYCIGGK
jgi:outer membrane protein assembly factor BamB